MPYFRWKGVTLYGVYKKGIAFARTDKELEQLLMERDIALVKCWQGWQAHFSSWFYAPSMRSKKDALHHLALLLDAGMALPKALAVVASQSADRCTRELVRAIASEVSEGISLHESLHKLSTIFDPIVVRMIEAGQEVGCLPMALQVLGDYMETTNAFKNKIRSASLLPFITLFFFLGVTLVIFIGVIPQFEHIFSSLGHELPWMTRALIALSHALRSPWLLLFGGITISTLAIMVYYRNQQRMHYFFDALVLYIPGIRSLVCDSSIVYFARSLGMLLAGGMHLVPALQVAKQSVTNVKLHNTIEDWQQMIAEGNSLSEAMRIEPGLLGNEDLRALVKVGEESGCLGPMLSKAAALHQESVERKLMTITTLVQPVLMIILGLLVAALIVAIYVPVFNLARVV